MSIWRSSMAEASSAKAYAVDDRQVAHPIFLPAGGNLRAGRAYLPASSQVPDVLAILKRLILDSGDNEVGLERPADGPFIDVALHTFERLSDRYRMQPLLRADDAYRVWSLP